ncbi:MAG: ABC transporter ATP-binding protein [Acidimicrobiales bacterium]
MAHIVYDHVTKRFGEVVAVDDLTLRVDDGELLVLLGPSGCGKTTALRMVAGLEEVDAGTVSIGGDVVNDVEPKDRDVAMVFQSYALYPHLTVAKNLEFPLRQHGIDKDERRRRPTEVARTLGIEELLGRKPGQLSGGQRQRVALGRAIVRSPKAFLMDEPLSNLDAALRVQTRADIVALQQRLATTTIYVTHDQVEAMTMGHRIAVMDHGRLQQVAAPQELYDRPANAFVAGFLGSPGMNLVEGQVVAGPAGRPSVRTAGGDVELAASMAGGPFDTDGTVLLGVRPEHLRLAPDGSLAARVLLVELLGAEAHVICELPDRARIVVRQLGDQPRPALGEAVRVAVDPASAHLFAPDGTRLGGGR